jgi:hypothetical protein
MGAVWLPFSNGAAENADGISAGQKLMEQPKFNLREKPPLLNSVCGANASPGSGGKTAGNSKFSSLHRSDRDSPK